MNDIDHRKFFAILEIFYAGKDVAALRRYSDDPTVPQEVRMYASGLLMRPWLPWDARRQLLMFVLIAAVVVTAVAFGSAAVLLLLFVPACFSPRLIGETLIFVSKVRRGA